MYICPKCKIFYQDQLHPCQKCQSPLAEVSLLEALQHTDNRFLKDSITGKDMHELPDSYKQYHIRSYLKNRSLFLDYDIQKNRMKHGPRLKRFLICQIDMTAVFNIPWFFSILSPQIFFTCNIHSTAPAVIQNTLPKSTPLKSAITISNISIFWKIF